MDLRGILLELKASTADAFLSFPLLLIAFIFLFGLLTSNTGLLFLFAGVLFLVPSIGNLTNLFSNPFYDGNSFSVSGLVKFLFSGGLVYGTLSGTNDGPTKLASSGAGLLGLQWLINYFMGPPSPPIATCGMLPGQDPATIFKTPSAWVLHFTFLTFFIFANGMSIYDLPKPTLSDSTDKSRQERLDERVTNRKISAIISMVATLLVFLVVLYLRYSKMSCENGFIESIGGIGLAALTGYTFFRLLVDRCGVRPVDVLGIVPGMINPDIVDAPIVCIGSTD